VSFEPVDLTVTVFLPLYISSMIPFRAGCLTALPVGMDDPIQRLRRIDQDVLQLRRSTYPVTLFRFMGLVGILFRSWIKPFSANYMTSAIMSNFPVSNPP